MTNEVPKENPLEKDLASIDMRGLGEGDLTSRIVNTAEGTPEQLAAFDILRGITKPYEDYFNGLVPDFVGQKTLQPGVKQTGNDDYWNPQYLFEVKEDTQHQGIYTDGSVTFSRHRTGRIPRWKYNWTCKQFELGNRKGFSLDRDRIDFDETGKIRQIEMGRTVLNFAVAELFTGSMNENMSVKNFQINLEDPKKCHVVANLFDAVNKRSYRRFYGMLTDGNFWGRADSGYRIMDLEDIAQTLGLLLPEFHPLPQKDTK